MAGAHECGPEVRVRLLGTMLVSNNFSYFSIIERKLSTAFIMEDDADWDVRLRSQMLEFAKGVRTVSKIPPTKPQDSPYGDDWDVLWPGHCGEIAPGENEPLYVINDDTTVAPKKHQPWLVTLADYPEQTRIVHRGIAPICTFAYAVSQRGAQKLLHELAIKPQGNLKYDNALAFACRDRRVGLKCFSVEPMLFYHHRPAGNVAKDSDILDPHTGEESVIREKGTSDNIVWSARLNLEQMITGSEDYVMQW